MEFPVMEEPQTVGLRVLRRDFLTNRHAQDLIDDAFARLIGPNSIEPPPKDSVQRDCFCLVNEKLQEVVV